MSRRVNQFRITVNDTGGGMGRVAANPRGPDQLAGTTVTLIALPDPGSTFAGWSGDCSGSGECVLTVDGENRWLYPLSRSRTYAAGRLDMTASGA